MRNLYKETNDVLERFDKTMDDVIWIGLGEYEIEKSNFIEVAKSTIYDGGFGIQEIPNDLIVVGQDFWLERHEYDGAEWWEFKQQPIKPKLVKEIHDIENDLLED